MPSRIAAPSRRQLFRLASLAPVAVAGCVTKPSVGSFTHGVASGDPLSDSLLLWTRYRPGDGGSAPLEWQVAADASFTMLLAQGRAVADPARDHCVKLAAEKLPADSTVYYRFRAPDGEVSITGRGRTLPSRGTRPMRFAVFSCSNIGFGYFNAYAHAAARNDIDLVLHLGDYIYEMGLGTYPNAAQRVPGRGLEPGHEIVALGDYRKRYAFYRADPDLQALHARHSMMAVWDDHEFANDSWKNGAQNHQPGEEGPWEKRRDVARQAYYEWLPIRDAEVLYRRVAIGDLADLILLDTRLIGRDHQTSAPRELFTAALDSPEYAAALARYRTVLENPARQLLGAKQEAWLDAALKASQSRAARWQILAQQVVAGMRVVSPRIGSLLPDATSAALRSTLERRAEIGKHGLTTTPDSWSGYMAARQRFLTMASAPGRRPLLLAGDTHNAWAFAHRVGSNQRMVAEFATPGVSSPGMENSVPVAPDILGAAMREANPEMLWCDTSHRGYMSLVVSRETATATWHLLRDIRQRDLTLLPEKSLTARATADGLAFTA